MTITFVFTDERIDTGDALCYFNAVVSGTISTPGRDDGAQTASDQPEEFEERLEFARAPARDS